MIPGYGDRVPLGHMILAVGEDVGDDTHRLLGRVDVRTASHVLLQNIVLNRAGDHVGRDSLFFGNCYVHAEKYRRSGIDGHGGGDLIQRDAAEEDLHVGQGIDGHADLADLTLTHAVVGVVSYLGGKVESHGKSGLPRLKEIFVAFVGLLGGTEAGVLPHGPEAAPIHGRLDPAGVRVLGLPGEYPYTRGVQPTMYRGRFWTMRQYAGFGTAKESNERYKYLLQAGQTGLSVAFDLPTQMGYDSDHGMSQGEVGKVGVAIDSLADMEILFGGIPLDQVSTSMTINSTAAILLCMYIAVAEKQGVSADKISGTIQNDILKEYMARGTYIYPP